MERFPDTLGFHMPAEWHPHTATWLSWPVSEENWPGDHLLRAEDAFVSVVEALHTAEQVNLLTRSDAEEEHIRQRLRQSSVTDRNIVFHRFPTADIWIRDYGPTFLVQRSPLASKPPLGMVRWVYNAWGGKYADLIPDGLASGYIADRLGRDCAVFSPGIVLEGGSIEVNGSGLCLTTAQCLLNPNRNPSLSRARIEEYLKGCLGLDHVIWLKGGIAGDDTDGHIDDIARFVAPKTVLVAHEPDSSDENALVLCQNIDCLTRFVHDTGIDLEIVHLPMPGPVVNHAGVRVPASYANFYIANRVVLLPVFNHPNDARAIRLLKELFPAHTVVPVDCQTLVWGLGAIHCASQQQPDPSAKELS